MCHVVAYLLSSFRQYQFILLGNRGTLVSSTCPELLPNSDPAGNRTRRPFESPTPYRYKLDKRHQKTSKWYCQIQKFPGALQIPKLGRCTPFDSTSHLTLVPPSFAPVNKFGLTPLLRGDTEQWIRPSSYRANRLGLGLVRVKISISGLLVRRIVKHNPCYNNEHGHKQCVFDSLCSM